MLIGSILMILVGGWCSVVAAIAAGFDVSFWDVATKWVGASFVLVAAAAVIMSVRDKVRRRLITRRLRRTGGLPVARTVRGGR